MLRAIGRIVALMLVAAGACGTLSSAAPLQLVKAVQPSLPVAAATALEPVDPKPPRLAMAASPPPSPTLAAHLPAPAQSPRVVAGTATRWIPPPVIDAQEVALVNLDSGRFLWQSNMHGAWAPASLTKIFTAMVAVDLLGMNASVTVPSSIAQLPGDSTLMGLSPGEQVTVRQLLYGVFLNSGNDAAETLATAATSRTTFIADMNAKAARLGLHSTHFLNPTGLDEPGHYSSAYDLAIAAIYLEAHYGSLVTIAATPSITFPATATHKAFSLVNLNKLLWTYPGVYGLKTGWTDAALGCLITTSSRGGHRLLGVMLGAPAGTAYAQMPKVLDYGYQLLGILPRPPSV